MAYVPDSLFKEIGVTDQQIIEAFEKNTPGLQESIQKYMQMYGLTNADLLAMVKHYAPEAKLDLDQLMVYTQIPNNPAASMFRGGKHAPVTGRQLAGFGKVLQGSGLAEKKQNMMQQLYGGPPEQTATPAQGVDVPTVRPSYTPQPMQDRPVSWQPQTAFSLRDQLAGAQGVDMPTIRPSYTPQPMQQRPFSPSAPQAQAPAAPQATAYTTLSPTPGQMTSYMDRNHDPYGR